MTLERVTLGIDGNAGFALLGENIQEGESEFVTVDSNEPTWTSAYQKAEGAACSRAYEQLIARLGKGRLPYALDPSHPRSC